MASSHFQLIVISCLWVLISLTFHEWAHACVALCFGDETPRIQGRFTLNPLAHISFFGSVVIPLLCAFSSFQVLGWARPVEVCPENFKYRNFGDLCCSLAGPSMNFLLAFLLVFASEWACRHGASWGSLLLIGASCNISLGLFNLIPIPPLDGAHVLKIFFRMSEATFVSYASVGTLLLLILINIPWFTTGFAIIHHSVFLWLDTVVLRYCF